MRRVSSFSQGVRLLPAPPCGPNQPLGRYSHVPGCFEAQPLPGCGQEGRGVGQAVSAAPGTGTHLFIPWGWPRLQPPLDIPRPQLAGHPRPALGLCAQGLASPGSAASQSRRHPDSQESLRGPASCHRQAPGEGWSLGGRGPSPWCCRSFS